MEKLNLTWEQFQELRVLCEAVGRSKSFGAQEGTLKNTIIDAKWSGDEVEIKLDIPA